MLKKLVIIPSLIFTGVLTWVCLINISDLPNVGFSFADKIFHLVTYAVFMLLWYFTCKFTFNFSRKQSLIYALLFSVVFGIIIEVLQDKLTTTRAFDVFDMVANTAGALLASVFLTFNNKFQVKNN